MDGEAITAQARRRVPVSELDRLDKRKWKNNGLAFAHYDGGGKSRRSGIDGVADRKSKRLDSSHITITYAGRRL